MVNIKNNKWFQILASAPTTQQVDRILLKCLGMQTELKTLHLHKPSQMQIAVQVDPDHNLDISATICDPFSNFYIF